MYLDLSALAGTIAGILVEPYAGFIRQLHAEGRISDAERDAPEREMQARCKRLGELVKERLPLVDGAAGESDA